LTTTRRTFLSSTLASGAGLALAGVGLSRSASGGLLVGLQPATPITAKPQRVLILGGTGFLGPICIEALRARGHKVTVFNRGATEDRRKRAGRPSAIPEGVEVLYGNRDPEKTADADDKPEAGDTPVVADGESPKGLTQLEKGVAEKAWDAVIDTSGYWPRMVKASAELLAKSVRQYVFVSTISVYSDNSLINMDESGPLHVIDDPTNEDMQQGLRYGMGKAACEAAAEAAMPGRVTTIRPGFIVGPRDTSGRFLYWPVRARRGGEILLPGTPEDPMQVIDVRDLADFIVACIEKNTTGVFNATGPGKERSFRAFIEEIKAGSGGNEASYAWVPSEFLGERGVTGLGLPLHVPPTGETSGFHRVNVAKAIAAGLTFRPLADTAKVTLEWFDGLPVETQAGILPRPPHAVTPDREKELIAAWRASEKGGG
jgi:2'-hydroxyisoflavone reductase